MRTLTLTLLITAALSATWPIHARRQNTTRPIPVKTASATTPKTKTSEPITRQQFDTITPPSGLLQLFGYEKPLQANVETLIVVNHSDTLTLRSILLQINYLTIDHQPIHTQERWIKCHIPPTQTRMLTFPSWDKQCSYYYYLSRPPRTQGVMPYRVKAKVLEIATDTEP